MKLSRTTVRLDPQLKKAAKLRATQLNITFQQLLNTAVKQYLDAAAENTAQETILFHSKDVGAHSDHLTRRDLS